MKQVWIALLCCALLLSGPASAPPARAALAPAASQPSVEEVATLGGRVTAAVVVGETAYVGEGASLLALDLGDPAAPQQLGRAPLKDTVRSIAVAGGYVYAVIGQELWTLDMRDPAQPVHLNTVVFSFVPQRVSVDGGLLYLMSSSETGSLLVYDLVDPARPALRSTLTHLRGAAVAGRMVYLIDTEQGDLVIVDLSDPRAPQTRSRYTPPGLPPDASYTGLTLSGTRLVVSIIESSARYLLTVDVTNPAAPILLADALFDTNWVYLSGNLLVAVGQGWQFRLVDFSDPDSPVVLSSYAVNTSWVQIVGDRLYVLGEGTLLILDITNPAAPVSLGTYAGLPWLADVFELRREGQRLYAIGASGVQILDVSQPLTPTLQGSVPFQLLRWLRVDGDRLYGVDNQRLRIIDASDPLSPTVRAEIDQVNDARLVGDLLYLTTNSALQIYNISDIDNPVLLGQVSSVSRQVWVIGTYAYLASFYSSPCGRLCTEGRVRLAAVDVSAPASPTVREEIDFLAYYSAGPSAVVGPALYLGGSLSLVDLSDPNDPVARDAGPMGWAAEVQLDGTRAYAVASGALRTVDLSDPLSPKLIGELPLGNARALAVEDGLAYVAAGGLRVVDVSDPANLRPRASYLAPVLDLALVDDVVYLALGYGGLRVVRVNPDAFSGPVYMPLIARF
ncbi:MAG TPA: hypothetical protein VFS21_21585 [Roseiflexaceae bacterium]|nr:hypothetical protein [Roseiflexaceae bacterium]